MTEKEIIARIQEAGVIGAGGAGFPTYQKLLADADIIVVNGAECEPLIQVDQHLMELEADSLVRTLELLAEMKQAQGIFALKGKYHSAVDKLTKAMEGTNLKIHLLPNVYPVGDEHVLVYEATGRVVPAGGIPPQVKVIVINVETLLNVAKALADYSVTDKYVTVIGEVEKPGTYIVPVGMQFKDILNFAMPKINTYALIEGGPMMGKVVVDGVVTKTTKALLVLPEEHRHIRKKNNTEASLQRLMGGCCQCRECTDFCPRYLLGHDLKPHVNIRAVSFSLEDPSWLMSAKLCSECGLCEYYVCPNGLSPKLVNRRIKETLKKMQVKLDGQNVKRDIQKSREFRQVSVERLIMRLGLEKYHKKVPFGDEIKAANVKILLKQSIGAPSKPLVKTGDFVEKGQIIAKPSAGNLGTSLHASITGKVKIKKDAIIITADN